MSIVTADKLTRGIDELAKGDVDNVATHLNSRMASISGETDAPFIYNTFKGHANEFIIGSEVFGAENVRSIGKQVDDPNVNGDADLLLEDGRAVEAKARTSGLGGIDIEENLDNAKEVQRSVFGPNSEKASEPVVFVVNNPESIYPSDDIGGELLENVNDEKNAKSYPVRFVTASELDSGGSISRFINF